MRLESCGGPFADENPRATRSTVMPLWHTEKGNRRPRSFSGAPKWKEFRGGGPFWNFGKWLLLISVAIPTRVGVSAIYAGSPAFVAAEPQKPGWSPRIYA